MNIAEKAFHCRRCGRVFRLRAKNAFYCADCRGKVRSEQVMRSRAARNPHIARGVGSGGNQWGRKNHRYKDGLSHYRENYCRAHPGTPSCVACGSTKNVVIHHIDRDRKNNQMDNLIALCRCCHAQVHGLAAHLGVTPMVDKEDE